MNDCRVQEQLLFLFVCFFIQSDLQLQWNTISSNLGLKALLRGPAVATWTQQPLGL